MNIEGKREKQTRIHVLIYREENEGCWSGGEWWDGLNR